MQRQTQGVIQKRTLAGQRGTYKSYKSIGETMVLITVNLLTGSLARGHGYRKYGLKYRELKGKSCVQLALKSCS